MAAEGKDNSLAQLISLAAAAVAILGGVYNVSYFLVSDIDLVMLLDYTDFLYTPIYLLMPSILAALIVLSLRTLWSHAKNAAAIDRGASVLAVAFCLFVNLLERDYLVSVLDGWAVLIGNILILLSLGICLAWIVAEAMKLPDATPALVFAAIGFILSDGLYAANVARADLHPTKFGDRLMLKGGEAIDDVHIARITGKGVFFTWRDKPGVLSFQRTDAYEGIDHTTN
jgi:hypothetical protein